MSDFSNKSLEGELSDEELGRLLVSSNLSESDGTWLISVGLLDTSCAGGALSGSLGCKLLSWGFATSGLCDHVRIEKLIRLLACLLRAVCLVLAIVTDSCVDVLR